MEADAPVEDVDTVVRMMAIETTKWLLDHSDRDTFDLDEVLATAMQIEDYIQDGGTVNMHCNPGSEQFVR